jgi:hypothetical protein
MMKLSFKPHIEMTEIEDLARQVSAHFVKYPDEIKVDLICKNEQGEDEVIGVIHNPKLRGMYDEVHWNAQRHAIKAKVRTVKVQK